MFTTPCFIHKNTPKLIKHLEEIGYTKTIFYHKGADSIIVKNGWIFTDVGFFTDAKKNCIDCGINEELFKALAALRDDSDSGQWFTDYENKEWILANRDNIVLIDLCYIIHKATPKELIEHFK